MAKSVEPGSETPARTIAQQRVDVIGNRSADTIRASGITDTASTGRTHERTRPSRRKINFVLARQGPFSNRGSMVNVFLSAGLSLPWSHRSLRGRHEPPQLLVRSAGAAMSTTGWRACTLPRPLSRSRLHPRPRGNRCVHPIGPDVFDYLLLTRLQMLQRTSGTARQSARRCAG
jgi:hypothetical protein